MGGPSIRRKTQKKRNNTKDNPTYKEKEKEKVKALSKGLAEGLSEHKHRTNPPPLLFWSSLCFATNMWTSFFTQQYLYSFFFASLTISSLLVHSWHTVWTNLWDKIWVMSIIVYGGRKMCIKWYSSNPIMLSLCVATFLCCVWVYTYGYYTQSLCFSQDVTKGNMYHAYMHVIASFGHHIIIFL